MEGKCEFCAKRAMCGKPIGHLFGFCNTDFVPAGANDRDVKRTTFEVRQIDAWRDVEDTWTWNTSYLIGTFRTGAKDERRAFYNYLRRQGIAFHRGRVMIEDSYDDVYTIVDRKTGEPLFAAIPC